MAAWPTSLPQLPLVSGFAQTAAGGTVVTEMDVGPAKRRRRYTLERVRVQIALVLTTAQIATLETFWTTTLAGGVDAFDWVSPITRASASCAFLSRPRYTAIGASKWSTEFEIEVLP